MRQLALRWGFLICALACLTVGVPRAGAMTPRQGLLRLHILANSTSPHDQAIKLAVRDHLLAFLRPSLIRMRSVAAAATLVKDQLPGITAQADRVLRAYHTPYQAVSRLGWFSFPEKRIGDLVLPSGRYLALKVVLGRGAGHNWWCVLFPGLCFASPAGLYGQSEPLPQVDRLHALAGKLPTQLDPLRIRWFVPQVWRLLEKLFRAWTQGGRNHPLAAYSGQGRVTARDQGVGT